MIVGLPELQPRFREIGQCKIGGKNYASPYTRNGKTYYPPIKFDHFEFNLGLNADGRPIRDEALHKIVGDKPRRIPIMLPFDAMEGNYYDWLGWYTGEYKMCSGDGKSAMRLNMDTKEYNPFKCTCEKYLNGECKPHAILNFMPEAAGRLGGVYSYRTTSRNAIRWLRGSLIQIMALGVPLSMVPLELVMAEKIVKPKGKPQSKAWIVHLEFIGNTSGLFEAAKSRLEIMQGFGAGFVEARRVAQSQAKMALESQFSVVQGVAEEFHPENITRGQIPNQAAKLLTIGGLSPEKPAEAAKAEPTPVAAKPVETTKPAAAKPIATETATSKVAQAQPAAQAVPPPVQPDPIPPTKPTAPPPPNPKTTAGPSMEEAMAAANAVFGF